MSVPRGCGTRQEAGIYLCCGTSKWGKPIEHFLKDYPQPLSPDLRLSPIGVRLIERDGVTHVLDWVGEGHYPNVADYIEEVRRYGSSRHVARNLDFSKLTLRSKHLFVHPRAIVTNWHDFFKARRFKEGVWQKRFCPKHRHEEADGPCLGIGYHLLNPHDGDDNPDCSVTRSMPSFVYAGYHAPEGFTPKYQPGIFMSLPIHQIEVIRGGTYTDSVARASASELPIHVMEE